MLIFLCSSGSSSVLSLLLVLLFKLPDLPKIPLRPLFLCVEDLAVAFVIAFAVCFCCNL